MSNKAPLFAVFKGGVCYMSTEHEQLIPKREILLQMQKLGYTFKRDGKAWRPGRK